MKRYKIELTQTLLGLGRVNTRSTSECTGAVVLSEVNAKYLHTDLIADWGNTKGYLARERCGSDSSTRFFIAEDRQGKSIGMMYLEEPTTVYLRELTRDEFNKEQ